MTEFMLAQVSKASKEKQRVHQLHMQKAKKFQQAEQQMQELKTKLERFIVKSEPYFDIQREFQHKLEVKLKFVSNLVKIIL